VERERKRKQAKKREKNEGRLARSLAFFFARAPLSERLEQAKFEVTGMIEWGQKSKPQKVPWASNKTQKNPWTKN